MSIVTIYIWGSAVRVYTLVGATTFGIMTISRTTLNRLKCFSVFIVVPSK